MGDPNRGSRTIYARHALRLRIVGETIHTLKRRLFHSGYLQAFINQHNQQVHEMVEAEAEEDEAAAR